MPESNHPEIPPPAPSADGDSSGPRSPVLPGDVVGDRYVVGALIGEGGMGVVCEATHIALGVPVAIKLIRPAYKHDAEFVQRFLNEARRAALLKGEHVARVHDVGQLDSGEPYLVMERLEGVVLDSYLQRAGPLLPADAVSLALQVCDGLAEAHAQGVVHRDIKPGNLFLVHLPNGRVNVKILDFGISKQLNDEAPSTLTNRERSLGSPWYMSPEQMIDSSKVDHRSDVWSLGVVLYELLTNERPFDGTSVPEVCARVLTGGTPSLPGPEDGIDPGLEAVVFRCLAKEPADRYPDVLALADALQPFTSNGHDMAGDRSWEPIGDLVAPGPGRDKTPGSIAPLVTTRRTGRPSKLSRPPPRGRRAHVLAMIGIAATLLLAVAGVAKLALEPGEGKLANWRSFAAARLDPSPDTIPLDRGNEPLYMATPGPALPAPEVVPMPSDRAALQALATSDVAPSNVAPPPTPRDTPRTVSRRRWPGDSDDNPYAEPSPARRSALELRAALARAREQYTRFGADTESAAPEPSQDEPRRETQASEPKPVEVPTPTTEARDRYGL